MDNMVGQMLVQAALCSIVVICSTYCFTTIRYLTQTLSTKPHSGQEPPTLPYTIPGVGSAWALIRAPHRFFDNLG